jgi:hypothetical protein
MPKRILLFLFALVSVASAQSQTALSRPAIVDVRTYGAKGCPNDDTQAFQAAAKAALYGEMFVPTGQWCVDPIGVAGVRVVGTSRWGSIIQAYSAGGGSTYLLDGKTQVDGVTPQPPGTQAGFMAERLTINCNGTGRSGLRGYYGQMEFQDIWTKGCYDGFNFEMPFMSRFQDLEAQSNTNDGFVFASSGGECMNSLTVQNLWGHSNNRYGLKMGCFNYVTASNNAMQENGDDDWHIDGTTAGGGVSSNLTLLSPASERSAGRPFYLKNVRGFTITSPLVLQPSTPHDWITLDNAAGGVIMGWVPLQRPVAGTYHLVSINNASGQAGVTGLVQVYATTSPASGRDFVFLNSGIKAGPASTLLRSQIVAPYFIETGAPATTGAFRLQSGSAINFRDDANGGDVVGLSKDSSDVVQVGGKAGVKIVGPLKAQAGLNTGTDGAANKLVCWKDRSHLGYCSTNPDSTGSCTCN